MKMNNRVKVSFLSGIALSALFFLILQIFFVPYQGLIAIPLLFSFLMILIYAIYFARVYPGKIVEYLFDYAVGSMAAAGFFFPFFSFGLMVFQIHSCIWFPLVEVSGSMLLWFLGNFYAFGAIVFVITEFAGMVENKGETESNQEE